MSSGLLDGIKDIDCSTMARAMEETTKTAAKMLNDDELEQNWAAEGVVLSDDDEVVSVGSDDEVDDVDEDVELAPTAKREREGGDDDDEDGAADEKKKKKQKTAQRKPSKGLHKMTLEEHFKILNDFYVKNRGGQMTTLELAEGLSESHFALPEGLGKHTLPNLPLYLRHLMPSWRKDFRGKGKKYDKSPYFLIVSSSALRAVELLKHFNSFGCKVAKLFAKHMKVDEQEIMLAKTFHPIAVGTPGRIKKLMEMEALSLQHTTHVFIDMEKDKKSLTLLELKDTAKDVLDMLHYYILPELKNGKLKLVLY